MKDYSYSITLAQPSQICLITPGLIGQAIIDTWGDSGAAEENEKHDGWVIVSDEGQR